MSNRQLFFLCGVIMFSVANIFRPALLEILATLLFVCVAWGKPRA
jgi:hypothetical protein